jgi:DNA-directed RNA polymerase subunit RPC12/RpoP
MGIVIGDIMVLNYISSGKIKISKDFTTFTMGRYKIAVDTLETIYKKYIGEPSPQNKYMCKKCDKEVKTVFSIDNHNRNIIKCYACNSIIFRGKF